MDICYQGLCGENADCKTIGHRPTCLCPPGTSGNPNIKCNALLFEKPLTPPPPISGTTTPPVEEDIIPIVGSTTISPSPTGIPVQRPPLEESMKRPEPPPLLPPVLIACENNDDCNVDNSCINLFCYDALVKEIL